MKETPLVRLDLRAPLVYADAPELQPFTFGGPDAEQQEQLFCFELDAEQSLSIEPDRERFLGDMLFSGRGSGDGTARLPAGLYLFTQRRQSLGREDCIDLAIEQQKDGLWERLKPENRLYLRFLYEDGDCVTQLFRPYRD
jgi:hypothetical protein